MRSRVISTVDIFRDDGVFRDIQFGRLLPVLERAAGGDARLFAAAHTVDPPLRYGSFDHCLINDVGIYVHKKQRDTTITRCRMVGCAPRGRRPARKAMEELEAAREARVQESCVRSGIPSRPNAETSIRRVAAYYVSDVPLTVAELARTSPRGSRSTCSHVFRPARPGAADAERQGRSSSLPDFSTSSATKCRRRRRERRSPPYWSDELVPPGFS